MEYVKKREEGEEQDTVEDLLKLPVQNLESRIVFLENEIRTREHHCMESDERLGNEILRGKGAVERVRYADIGGPLEAGRRKLQERVDRLEEERHRLFESAFRDLASLKVQLQEAREQFETARTRLDVVRNKSLERDDEVSSNGRDR